MAAPDRLYFTDDDEACRLIATDPFALLVGLALDQQVTVQTAFAGPQKIKQRLGTLDPATLAGTDPEKLAAAFREKPAVHRFPGNPERRRPRHPRDRLPRGGGTWAGRERRALLVGGH